MTDMMPTESGCAEVNGARLYYQIAGAGHPLVLLHGHLVDSSMWDDQFDLFARRYRVIRYDARGFGKSSLPPEPYAHHRDLYGLLKLLDVASAYLVGLSGGGQIATDFALEYPRMVDALVLVGPGLGGFEWPAEPDPLAVEMREAYERGDKDWAVELSLRFWTDGPARTPDQVNPAARERIRAMTAHLFALPDVEAPEEPLEPPAIGRLAAIRAPTLLVVGEHDVQSIQEIIALLESGIAGAKRVIIPDAAHHPNMEHPTLFNQAVLTFLGAQDAGLHSFT
jgi:3-oxoadipate enol-lactonase